MIVFVVMANDYPDSVWGTEALANAYVKERAEAQLAQARKDYPGIKSNYLTPRIYYRCYPFTVQEQLS